MYITKRFVCNTWPECTTQWTLTHRVSHREYQVYRVTSGLSKSLSKFRNVSRHKS